jgi:hypothetical protein
MLFSRFSSVISVAVCGASLALAQGGANMRVIEANVVVSPEARHMKPFVLTDGPKREKPLRLPHGLLNHNQVDPVAQTAAGPLVATTNGLNFAGLGQGDYGFVVTSAPPDTVGAVGATQYVQWVNTSFVIFNKTTGALQAGPIDGNTLFAGLGGACAANNDGDPIVRYDALASRWILTQFSVTGGPPFFQCVAVSTTSDAAGSYHLYAFQFNSFNDYPKLGVWPDAYYLTTNNFNGNTFVGAETCALNRTAMIAGTAANAVCFQLSNTFASLLPSDLDGLTPPPAGSPNFLLNFGTNSLRLWKFHVNFVTPASSTLTGPTTIPVAAFAAACNGGTCIPQPSTTTKLDSLGDRLMFRNSYRNFGDHEAMVLTHSVTVSAPAAHSGIRWYELRSPNATPVVFQQGTFAPDSNWRWMGSIATDRVGNIAVGYSVSSTSVFPSIRYTGRAPTDPLGTMQAENVIVNGTGSQNARLARWGDYSALTVDPVDQCTFFYTQEYIKTTGSFNWSTRIATFKFPSCI